MPLVFLKEISNYISFPLLNEDYRKQKGKLFKMRRTCAECRNQGIVNEPKEYREIEVKKVNKFTTCKFPNDNYIYRIQHLLTPKHISHYLDEQIKIMDSELNNIRLIMYGQ